jgi:hypothetical protein
MNIAAHHHLPVTTVHVISGKSHRPGKRGSPVPTVFIVDFSITLSAIRLHIVQINYDFHAK